MSPSLSLLIAVVNLVDEAKERQRTLDIEAEAARLLRAHPEADMNEEEIEAMLRQQQEMVDRDASVKRHR